MSVSSAGAEAGERGRLFVALDLDEAARPALASWRDEMVSAHPGVRPVADAALHVTLCFLGTCAMDDVDAIAAACAGASAAVSDGPIIGLALGAGMWLPRRRPRVLGVAIEDDTGALARLRSALASALEAGGWYRRERRPFLPHVTVARVGKDQRPPKGTPAAPPGLSLAPRESVTLYRSHLSPRGSRYEAVRVVPVGGAAGGFVDAAGPALPDAPIAPALPDAPIAPALPDAPIAPALPDAPIAPALPDAPIAPALPDAPMSVVRRFHAEQARAYAGGDLRRLERLLTPDVIWHVPGRSRIAGEHHGVDAVLTYFNTRRRLTDETFRVTVHDVVAAAGDRVIQLAGGRAVRDGVDVSWETVGIFRVADGRIAECWLVPFDLYAFDAVWS